MSAIHSKWQAIVSGIASAHAGLRNSTAKRGLIELKQAWKNGYAYNLLKA